MIDVTYYFLFWAENEWRNDTKKTNPLKEQCGGGKSGIPLNDGKKKGKKQAKKGSIVTKSDNHDMSRMSEIGHLGQIVK